MINYVREDNRVYAYFYGVTTDDISNNYYAWSHDLLRYFNKNCPGMSYCRIADTVHDVVKECIVSGMKFYGTAKCHPDDEYSQALGQHIAKHRLLDKYLSVRARIARRLSKEVYKDYYKIAKIAKTDRKKGW